jgi:hypothetical protein
MSRIILCNKNMTEREIKKKIYKLMRPLIRKSFAATETELETEFKRLFDDQSNYDADGEHMLYKLTILNNTQVHSGLVFTYRSPCEFCGVEHKDNCEFTFSPGCRTLNDMIKKSDKRDFVLVVQWRSEVDLGALENAPIKQMSDDNLALQNADSRLTLYDCLNCFMLEETLSGNDKWYCNKCKDHVVATKKMEVYRTPEILIIHFKRFSHNRASMFGSRKLSDKIEFPIDGLNMSSYVLQN